LGDFFSDKNPNNMIIQIYLIPLLKNLQLENIILKISAINFHKKKNISRNQISKNEIL